MRDDGRRSFPHSPPDRRQQEVNVMKEQQVAQILQEIAEQEVPANLDLWPAIQARLQSQERPSRWSQVMPASRLGWAFLVLILFLAFGAVAYALAPIVMSRLFQQEAGLRHVEQANLVQELNLSQTVDGVTVTLQRAYADANRVVVGFTVIGPDGQRYDPHRVILTDANGTVFPPTIGMGVTGQSDILEVELPPGQGGYVFSFDAAAIQGTPPALYLRLMMELEEFVLPTDAFELPPIPDSPPAEPPDSMVVEVLPAPEGAIVGPFTFDFSVPFIPGCTVEAQQTVEAAGIAVRLERVVVTPSETRAILCFDPPDGDSEWTPTIVTLDAGDGQDLSGFSRRSGIGEESCSLHSYPAALADRSGLWTLTVTELVGMDPTPPGEQTRLAGPWVFHFVVP